MTVATTNEVFAVVLAAGSAKRFGATKQLAEIDGVPLITRAMKLASDVCSGNTVLVVGHDWQAVSAACEPLSGFTIVNDRYCDGLGTSISQAVSSLHHVARAIIILLTDQPLISTDHVRSLRQTWSGANDEIVATAFAGTLGPPVLFPRGCFDELIALEGDKGAQHLLDDARFIVKSIECQAAAVDIDTPEDLDAL